MLSCLKRLWVEIGRIKVEYFSGIHFVLYTASLSKRNFTFEPTSSTKVTVHYHLFLQAVPKKWYQAFQTSHTLWYQFIRFRQIYSIYFFVSSFLKSVREMDFFQYNKLLSFYSHKVIGLNYKKEEKSRRVYLASISDFSRIKYGFYF